MSAEEAPTISKSAHYRVGKFCPHPVLTAVKTGLGKTPKTHMKWAKVGKTNFLN